MPTYGYRCTACGHTFERIQKMTDPALTECESCGGAVKKMLYPVGISFKGSGFYVNDYTKSTGGSTNTAKSDSESTAPKADSTPAAPAAESKPAAPASDSKPASTTTPAAS